MPIIKPKGMIIKGENYSPQLGTVVFGRQSRKNICCPRCNEAKKLRKKDRVIRLVPHVHVLDERVWIQWEGHKYHCLSCGRYFREQFPGLLPRRRYTEAYRKEVFNLHRHGISQSDLGRIKHIGTATVERWFHQLLERKNREYSSYRYPEQLGIDEHRFSKKISFSTTLCDLSNHRVLDLLKGRSSAQITTALKSIPGRHSVRMVNMDLSETYRSIVKDVFPNACIVTDRFHVIRLIIQSFLKTVQSIHPHKKTINSIYLFGELITGI